MPSASMGPYPTAPELVEAWTGVAEKAGAAGDVIGRSCEGRDLLRIDLGTRGAPVVLLSGLMHGIEVIGSLALLELVRWLGSSDERARALRERAHFVVLPIVNPDSLFANMSRLARGERAYRRCNARGVDLNRNFPHQTTRRLLHPFSGSRYRLSAHYRGPHPLSEPESRAVRDVAVTLRPSLSLAFHSFGNMLLYPWAYTKEENPRASRYRELGEALRALVPYRVQQARQLYAVLGDMDDWLDAELGTLAMTVEVGHFDVRLRELRRLFNPFAWMNPRDIRQTTGQLLPGIAALLDCALSKPGQRRTVSRRPQGLPSKPPLAAK
jgi:predicted deacylase